MNQKLNKRFLPPINDVVTDISEDGVLVNLMEILSEREFPYKTIVAKFKAQRIENVSKALQFVWDCGVVVALKPSAENLVDASENHVSQFVIIRKLCFGALVFCLIGS